MTAEAGSSHQGRAGGGAARPRVVSRHFSPDKAQKQPAAARLRRPTQSAEERLRSSLSGQAVKAEALSDTARSSASRREPAQPSVFLAQLQVSHSGVQGYVVCLLCGCSGQGLEILALRVDMPAALAHTLEDLDYVQAA